MRIIADHGKCLSYANCVAAAPEVYDLGDESVILLKEHVPSDLQDRARKGARLCPAKALTVVDD